MINYKNSRKIAQLSMIVSITSLSVMTIITFLDVVMRFVGKPISGVFEVTQVLMVILVFFAFPLTQLDKANAQIDIIYNKFSTTMKFIVGNLVYFLSIIYFLLISWRGVIRAIYIWERGEETSILSIPIFPFYFLISFGSFLICLILIYDIKENIYNLKKSNS